MIDGWCVWVIVNNVFISFFFLFICENGLISNICESFWSIVWLNYKVYKRYNYLKRNILYFIEKSVSVCIYFEVRLDVLMLKKVVVDLDVIVFVSIVLLFFGGL